MAVLKTMAGINVAERRVVQEGVIKRMLEGNLMEFRLSTLPSKYGEKGVLRILKSNAEMLNLDCIVSNIDLLSTLRSMIQLNRGLIIVAGPTGSGKSTTLYAILNELNTGENNILAIEDPIEYTIPGITQIQVLREKSQTFASVLQSAMRHDPDVILIGETRDSDTMRKCINASVEGHLVLTSLHACDTSEAIRRISQMGIPSDQLVSISGCILAQNLVRRVCSCSVLRPLAEEEVDLAGMIVGTPVRQASTLSVAEKEKRLDEGTLCPRCLGTGYKGRIAVFELLPITVNVASKIIQISFNAEDINIDDCQETPKPELDIISYARSLVRDQITTVGELKRLNKWLSSYGGSGVTLNHNAHLIDVT